MKFSTPEASEQFLADVHLEADNLPPADTDREALESCVELGTLKFGEFKLWARKAEKSKAEAAAANARRTTCPLTAQQLADFADSQREISFPINGATIKGKARQFSSGSYGWNVTGKTRVTIDGLECPVQVTGNLVLIGSGPKD
jgi:hypothetical protein